MRCFVASLQNLTVSVSFMCVKLGLLHYGKNNTEDVIGDWRKLYIEELCNLYCSPNTSTMKKSKGMRGLGHVTCRGVLVGEPEGRRSLGRPRCRWEGNFEVNLKLIGWVGVDWIDLAHDRVK